MDTRRTTTPQDEASFAKYEYPHMDNSDPIRKIVEDTRWTGQVTLLTYGEKSEFLDKTISELDKLGNLKEIRQADMDPHIADPRFILIYDADAHGQDNPLLEAKYRARALLLNRVEGKQVTLYIKKGEYLSTFTSNGFPLVC